ncbi:MAG: efflux RND transporter permease subunit, partial [Myxococcales bacterium]|nr:efflux RND transporter permease subunit [Myxococcales bacterium]
MNRLVAFCVRNRLLVIFVVLLIGSLGVRVAQQLPIDAVPDVTNVQVQVLTNAPALGPAEVEQYVTVPVESAMAGLPNVEEVRSLSRFGLSAVTVVFEEGTDIYFARQMVSERLSEARADIPEGYGSPEMGPISTGLGEIYQFEVRGDPMCPPDGPDTDECYTLMELRTILDWYVAYQLRPIPGVVEVNPFGGELKTYEVSVDPARLNALDLSLGELFEALSQNNANEGGGYIVRGGEQRVIRAEALVSSLEDIRDIRVTTRNDGTPVFVRDIGEVDFAPMVRQGAVTRDGRGEVVTASVMMLMGANSGEVSRAVRERLDELAPGLPPGVTIETYYDRSVLVDRTIRTVAVNLIEGGILVIVVLLLMLGNLRGGLLVAAVIPLSLLFTFISMRFFGVSGNLMSL